MNVFIVSYSCLFPDVFEDHEDEILGLYGHLNIEYANSSLILALMDEH